MVPEFLLPLLNVAFCTTYSGRLYLTACVEVPYDRIAINVGCGLGTRVALDRTAVSIIQRRKPATLRKDASTDTAVSG